MKRSPLPPRRKPLKRSPITKRVGRKREREAEAWAECKAVVAARSRGWCEAWDVVASDGTVDGELAMIAWASEGCSRGLHAAHDPHHVWPEDRDVGRHDPDRVLDLCRRAHDWTHHNPKHASKLGLLRPERKPQ
jgi:hypothetical protein